MDHHRLHPADRLLGRSIEDVKTEIERLPPEERAMLRLWLLARFYARGYPVPVPPGESRWLACSQAFRRVRRTAPA